MADLEWLGEGAQRAAFALLRANGGRTVFLRMPAPESSSDAEQLGLATPLFQDAELGPAVFRKAGSTSELLLEAGAVTALVGSLAFDSAAVLFRTAAGLLVDDVLYAIEASVAMQAQGQPYAYKLTLRKPAGA